MAISIVSISWVIFVAYWTISAFFVKESVTKRKIGWRIAVFLGVFLLIFFFERQGAKTGSLFLDSSVFSVSPAIFAIGSALCVFGLGVAIWARTYLGRNWSGYVTYKKDHELVMGGPYKFVRHPIYSSMLFMIIGTFLYYGTTWIILLLIFYMSIFLWRIKKEEEIMIKLFGKRYIDYMKRTKALIPFVV